jgi:hypothetical protein
MILSSHIGNIVKRCGLLFTPMYGFASFFVNYSLNMATADAVSSKFTMLLPYDVYL